MSLHGVGIDVADVRRIARLVESYGARFTHRWFVLKEVAQCNANESPEDEFAVRFAAKEAVWKSLGIRWDGPVPWRSIIILYFDRVPTVGLVGDVASAARAVGVSKINVAASVHDDRAFAIAMAESLGNQAPHSSLTPNSPYRLGRSTRSVVAEVGRKIVGPAEL